MNATFNSMLDYFQFIEQIEKLGFIIIGIASFIVLVAWLSWVFDE